MREGKCLLMIYVRCMYVFFLIVCCDVSVCCGGRWVLLIELEVVEERGKRLLFVVLFWNFFCIGVCLEI